MSHQRKTFIKKGLFSIIVSTLYLILRNKEEVPENPPLIKTSYKTIYLSEKNYRQIMEGNWLLTIDFDLNKSNFKCYSNIRRYTNFAYLHVDSLFTSKLAAIFRPKRMRSSFIIANGYFYAGKNRVVRIEFDKRLDESIVCNYSLFLVYRVIKRTLFDLLDEYFHEVIMFMAYFWTERVFL